MALKFRFNNKTYTLPVVPKTADTTQLASNGSLVIKTGTDIVHTFLVPYKAIALDYIRLGNIYYYYSSKSPSIHCRKNNTNYSCCNNYQETYHSTWTFYSLYSKNVAYRVQYSPNSFLGPDYNCFSYHISLDPSSLVTRKDERPDCIFKGWGTAADGSGDNYEIGQERSTSSDATFYALWARVDAGFYTADEFWDKLTPWFAWSGNDPHSVYSLARVSNREAFLNVPGPISIHIKVGSVIRIRSTANFFADDLYIQVDGTEYHISGPGIGNTLTIKTGGWLVDKFLKVSDWAYAFSRTETWKTTTEVYTEYRWHKHYFTISVTVDASSTDAFDFTVISNSGDWSGAIVSNPDTMIGDSWQKTLSVQVYFISQIRPEGASDTDFTIGLRDRTNSVNAVVATYNIKTNLSFGTTYSEE